MSPSVTKAMGSGMRFELDDTWHFSAILVQKAQHAPRCVPMK